MVITWALIRPLDMFLIAGANCFDVSTDQHDSRVAKVWREILEHDEYVPFRSKVCILQEAECAPPCMNALAERMRLVVASPPQKIAVVTNGDRAMELTRPAMSFLASAGVPGMLTQGIQEAFDWLLQDFYPSIHADDI